jgi:hypothetical protein
MPATAAAPVHDTGDPNRCVCGDAAARPALSSSMQPGHCGGHAAHQRRTPPVARSSERLNGRMRDARKGRPPVVTDDDFGAAAFAGGSEREPIVRRRARLSSHAAVRGVAAGTPASMGIQHSVGLRLPSAAAFLRRTGSETSRWDGGPAGCEQDALRRSGRDEHRFPGQTRPRRTAGATSHGVGSRGLDSKRRAVTTGRDSGAG